VLEPGPPYHGRAPEHPEIVARMRELLATEWDPVGVIRNGAGGASDVHAEHAMVIVGMLAAAARETEVQRYLRQVEQQALGRTLHPFDVRRRIAETAWRIVRGL